MIIARKIERISAEEARSLDWNRLTHDFSKDFIEAFIDMQPSHHDKLAVADLMLDSIANSHESLLFIGESEEHIRRIKSQLENGMFSPYLEVERLISEGKYKDEQIDAMVADLERVRESGTKQQESDLLAQIVEEAKNLGPLGVLYTEVMLRRIYDAGHASTIDELKAAMRDDNRVQYTFNAPVGVVC